MMFTGFQSDCTVGNAKDLFLCNVAFVFGQCE